MEGHAPLVDMSFLPFPPALASLPLVGFPPLPIVAPAVSALPLFCVLGMGWLLLMAAVVVLAAWHLGCLMSMLPATASTLPTLHPWSWLQVTAIAVLNGGGVSC